MNTSLTRQLATFVAAVLICLQTACTTLSPVVTDPTGAHVRTEVKAGDTVRAVMADGSAHSLLVSAVNEASLVGRVIRAKGSTDAAGSQIELPYRDIQQLEVQRVSAVKTTAIAAAVALVAAVAIASGGGSHTPGYSR